MSKKLNNKKKYTQNHKQRNKSIKRKSIVPIEKKSASGLAQ